MSNYYGNSLPVKYSPVTITLNGSIPVHRWGLGTQYWYNSCGFASGCNDLQSSSRGNMGQPLSGDTGLAIETPSGPVKVYGVTGGGNCGGSWLGETESWCWVNENALTHVFGEQTDAGATIPEGNTQWGIRDAAALQITPFNKVMNTSDGTMKTFTANYENTRYFDNNANAPTFKSISFKLPDPTEQVDIDSSIPWILLNYAAKGFLDMNQLNTYLSGYLFTNVNGNPRISFATTPPTSYASLYTYLTSIISKWMSLTGNTYKQSGENYCSGINLTNAWCTSKCGAPGPDSINCDKNLTTFCSQGGNGNLPQFDSSWTLPTTTVTQQTLDDAFPNYTKYADVCACSMPSNYYQQLDIMNVQKLGKEDLGVKSDEAAIKLKKTVYNSLGIRGGIGGYPKCDAFTKCRTAGAVSNVSANGGPDYQCPNVINQVCQQSASNNIGSVSESSNVGNINQAMSCIVNDNGGKSGGVLGLTPTPPSIASSEPPSSPPSSDNYFKKRISSLKQTWNSYSKKKKIIIISSISLLFFILFVLMI